MIIFNTHDSILTYLLLILTAVVDLYVCMVAVRLILRLTPLATESRAILFVQVMTDPLMQAVRRRCSAWMGRDVPIPTAWAIVCVSAVLLRYLLVWLIAVAP